MWRHWTTLFLALLAIGLFASPAIAGDEALRRKVWELEQTYEALSIQQATPLEQAVETYLDETGAWEAAAGKGMRNVTITSAFTANIQGTLDQDPGDRTVVSGDVDLGFHLRVTRNLDFYITATAAAGGGPASTANSSTPTFGGATDGVGTNGNVSTTGTGRGINVYEAYIVHSLELGKRTLHWAVGAMDPRAWFLPNAFADDENTQFTNNLFDDVASVLWQTGSSAATTVGLYMWISFGDLDSMTASWGYFNGAGRFFEDGSWFLQFSWKGKVAGRETNVSAMVNFDDVSKSRSGNASVAWGVSWDWWATDEIGVFVRIAGNESDVFRANPVQFEVSFGGQMQLGDDILGVAIAFVGPNTKVTAPTADDELTLEVYYRVNLEDGRLQVTPYLMFVNEPSGGVLADDTLFLLGVRVHVPF